jgi:hypothetical protein
LRVAVDHQIVVAVLRHRRLSRSVSPAWIDCS